MNIAGNNYSVTQLLIAIVVIAGMIALAGLALSQMGIPVPPGAISALWIVGVVVVAVLLLMFLASLLGGQKPTV